MPTLIILYFIPIFYQRCVHTAHEQEYRLYLKEAQSFLNNYEGTSGKSTVESIERKIEPFNPNMVNKEILIELGIDDKTASNWINYLRSGANFRTWEDLKKIYGMEEAVLLKLRDYLVFDTIPTKKEYRRPAAPAMAKIPFSEADSITLQIVPGIGAVTAGRIIKFRENLGGLHHKSQLLDVYGVEEELVERVFEHFTFDPGISSRLDINSLSLAELAQHPYITYAQAKVIMAYRDQHGPYEKAEDLLKIKIFTREWLDKLEPYLEF